MRDWQIEYRGLFPLSECSKQALVYMDIVSSLTQSFPYRHTDLATPLED